MSSIRWFLVVASMLHLTEVAAQPNLKLPFPSGETWTCTKGYYGPGHKNNGTWFDDRYALDFAEAGCDSLGKEILAAAAGTVEIQSLTDKGGYGINLLIDHGSGYKSRYAHLETILVDDGVFVQQGQPIGIVGNTGNVVGQACSESPGMHLHFVLYHNGVGAKPEPMSEYTSISAGKQYTSDNVFGGDYTYSGNLQTCYGPISGGEATSWIYTCETPSTTFSAGDMVQLLVGITDVEKNHRFKVEAWLDAAFQWEWSPGWVDVGDGWDTSFFWPTLSNALPGVWTFKIFVDTGGGYQYLDGTTVAVDVTDPYVYDGNGYTCHGPVAGGESTNWWFTCANLAESFLPQQIVWGILRLDDIWLDHQYQVEAYKNDVFQWSWSPQWNIVSTPPWEHSFFWFRLFAPSFGSWEFRVFVDTGSGFTFLDSLPFFVY